MAGKLPMGQKELLRGKVMELVKREQMTIGAAAKELKVSYRQGRRIYAAYQAASDFQSANAFVLVREPTHAELLKGITTPKSHLGRACDKLGVEGIPANSPQAKGRVERNHGLDQDRLVSD